MKMKKILLITYDNCDDSEVLYPLFRRCVNGEAPDTRKIPLYR